jgi:outer membrane receptor protein involved in Fe transport
MKKTIHVFLALVLVLSLGSFLGAQVSRQTGSIRGVIVEKDNVPIPGMAVSAAGASLIGTISAVTTADGVFRLTGLPPGTYTVTAELKGFKSLKREGVIVRVGSIVTINFETETTSIAEEITVVAPSPTVDVQSTKVGIVISSELLQRLPLNRNLTAIFNTVSGAQGTVDTYSGSIHGAQETSVPFEIDGVSSNDPAHNGLLQMPQFDTMEEIEISTGGLPAQIGNTGGGFVNIVTKSGGNAFHGQIQAYFTNKDLTQMLFSDEQMKAMSIGKPVFPIQDLDLSAIFGGPILKDKLWYFGSLAVRNQNSPSAFIPATLGGKQYTQYEDPQTQYEGFLKLTTQLSKKLRFFAMVNGRLYNRDVYVGGGAYSAYDNTFTLKGNTWFQTTANLTWLLDQNTFVDFRGGYVNRWYPIKERPENYNNITYSDRYTGYTWGGVSSWESYITRTTAQGSVRASRFQDNLLGGDHEIGLGVDYTWGRDRYFWARHSPYNQWLYNGNPYYYRGYYNLTKAHPTFGDGRLIFVNYTANSDESGRDMLEGRIGAYLQDAWTIKNRLTLNLGIRLDYYDGWAGDVTMKGVDGLRFDIGKSLESQLGYNHFAGYTMAPTKGVLKFTSLSPRLGLTYDLFGNGKTALKFSASRYAEAVPIMWFEAVSGAQMSSWSFDWWDTNGNGVPDSPLASDDRYLPTGGLGSLWRPDPQLLRDRIDSNMTTVQYTEAIVGIKHELFRNFAVELQYVHKHGWNEHASVLYNREAGQYWYNLEDAPAGWWVPFQTTIPAFGNYPAQAVTAYFMSNNAPWNNQFYRQTLLADAKRNYNGVELNFDKRYNDGWAVGGSISYSSSKAYWGSTGGGSTLSPTPSSYLNAYGSDAYDIPLVIKIYGSFSLPYGVVGSFFFRHASGAPYNRTVTVSPPSAWVAANNIYPTNYSVYVEPVGSRRNPDYDNMDVRVEKEFKLAFGKVSVFFDVYNLLGNTYVSLGQNPGGTWYPTDSGVTTGSYTAASNYGKVTGLAGVRTLKLSFRFQY